MRIIYHLKKYTVFFKNYFDFKESIITVWKILFMIYLIWTAVVLKNKKGSWF